MAFAGSFPNITILTGQCWQIYKKMLEEPSSANMRIRRQNAMAKSPSAFQIEGQGREIKTGITI
jgi:hypothetical protein